MSSYQNPTFPQMDYVPPTPTQTPGYAQFQPPFQPNQPIYPTQPQPQFAYPQQAPGQTGYVGMPISHTGYIPVQESYIENILRLNKDKIATVYMNFENSQWGSKIFKGAIEAAGKDHIILRDPVTQMRYLLLMIYLDYVTFDEEINYEYPFAAPNFPGMTPNIPYPGATPAPSFATPTPSTQYRKKENKKDE